MSSLLPYINYISNYNIINYSNLYNFFYLTMSQLNETKKKEYIDTMKLTLGLTQTNEFKMYIFKKFGQQSELLVFF